MISKWENGHPAKLASVQALSLYYGLSLNEILGFNLKAENKKIPVFKSYLIGAALYSEKNIIDYAYPLPGLDNHQLNKLFYLRISGDHMDREYVDNSLLLIQKGATIKNGDNGVVVRANNKGKVYKVKIQGNFITLIPSSHNTSYLPHIIDMKKENVNIIGRVIGSSKYYV